MFSRFPRNDRLASTPPPSGTDACRRILIIDDNLAIHRDFRKLLCPEQLGAGLDELDAAIFGTKSAPARTQSEFVVDSAMQGLEGLEAVRRMHKVGTPYALLFVDMRMPPGWDGVETLEHIWGEFPTTEAVICSAYSDYSWHEVIRRLRRPGLRLLTKPFATQEVLESAWSLTSRWIATQKRGSTPPPG
jgi:CheY-like chemotaxis protein